MAAEMYDNGSGGEKPTSGPGNAGGKPIRPILFGVAAVIALILVTLAFSRSPARINTSTSESGPIPQANYTPSSTSSTALGQNGASGKSDTSSRPTATAEGATEMSGSSALPPGGAPSPRPMTAPSTSAGQNFVAPPGPTDGMKVPVR